MTLEKKWLITPKHREDASMWFPTITIEAPDEEKARIIGDTFAAYEFNVILFEDIPTPICKECAEKE